MTEAIHEPTREGMESFLISITDEQAEYIRENNISLSRFAQTELDEEMAEPIVCTRCGGEFKNEHGAAIHWARMHDGDEHPWDVEFSTDHCKKISESLKGKSLSEEHRRKISQSMRQSI